MLLVASCAAKCRSNLQLKRAGDPNVLFGQLGALRSRNVTLRANPHALGSCKEREIDRQFGGRIERRGQQRKQRDLPAAMDGPTEEHGGGEASALARGNGERQNLSA